MPPDRIQHRAMSMVPDDGRLSWRQSVPAWGSSLEIILGPVLVVPRLSVRIEVVSVTFAYPLGPAFCSELLWAERRFGVIGVGIVNYCDEAVVRTNRRRNGSSIAVEALSIDDRDLFFTVLEVTSHERQTQQPALQLLKMAGDLVVCNRIEGESLYHGGKTSDITRAGCMDELLVILGAV